MLIERIHELVRHSSHGVEEIPAHQAVVELVVLIVYADNRISTDELEALERFDDEHADWDAGAFSVQQYLPVAVAKVRDAIADSAGADDLIADAATHLIDPSMRLTALETCAAIASIGGADPAGSEMLKRIGDRLK